MSRISIIIPAYNVENCIRDTLDAAYKTADENTELIVINDGSTDRTKGVINAFVSEHTGKSIKFVEQINQGVSVARNKGIECADGEYLIFCDGDDLCKDSLIDRLRSHIDNGAVTDMILWGFESFWPESDDRTIIQEKFAGDTDDPEKMFKSILYGDDRIRLGSFAVKKELLENYGLRYTEGCPLAQDVEFMYKCLSRASSISTIEENLFTYIRRKGSVMQRYNMNRFEAPRVMMRISDYVHSNTQLCNDRELEEFLDNGFILRHIMYSFDACLPYLKDNKTRSEFWHAYYCNYSDVESIRKKISREIKVLPKELNKYRCKLMLKSPKLYIWSMSLRNRMNTKKTYR